MTLCHILPERRGWVNMDKLEIRARIEAILITMLLKSTGVMRRILESWGDLLSLKQKEYKTWPNWMGKNFDWEFCMRLKFDYTDKWYIHKPESVFKNETNKIFYVYFFLFVLLSPWIFSPLLWGGGRGQYHPLWLKIKGLNCKCWFSYWILFTGFDSSVK